MQKSRLFGIEVFDVEVLRLARKCGCSAGSLPFYYLGLLIGTNMRLVKSWKPVVDKFTSRLNGWAVKTLSLGGRLTIIKSVLNSLPLYFFSLFTAPKTVISSLEKLRNKFF